jgi:hypothetical protein
MAKTSLVTHSQGVSANPLKFLGRISWRKLKLDDYYDDDDSSAEIISLFSWRSLILLQMSPRQML